MAYTDAQILENRRKVVEYLQKPNLRKARDTLRDDKGGRCCLGHMCDALGVERSGNSYRDTVLDEWQGAVAPTQVVQMLGLRSNIGTTEYANGANFALFDMKDQDGWTVTSLASLNDNCRISTQKIGNLLEGAIEGGDNTPWVKIVV